MSELEIDDIIFRDRKTKRKRLELAEALRHAKWLSKHLKHINYIKILWEGNQNIYWASPWYGHEDYNKSIALKNTAKNRKFAKLINSYLNFSDMKTIS